MPTVKFTQALKRFFPTIQPIEVNSTSIPEILLELEKVHSGLKSYIITEQGNLRQHVNIFVDGELIVDRELLADSLKKNSEVYIMQALSGG